MSGILHPTFCKAWCIQSLQTRQFFQVEKAEEVNAAIDKWNKKCRNCKSSKCKLLKSEVSTCLRTCFSYRVVGSESFRLWWKSTLRRSWLESRPCSATWTTKLNYVAVGRVGFLIESLTQITKWSLNAFNGEWLPWEMMFGNDEG